MSTWTSDQIEAARTRPLAPILAAKGYAITTLPNGAVLVADLRGLIIHANRWNWKSQGLFGNTIDFFTAIEGKTFPEAMEILLATPRASGDSAPARKPGRKSPADDEDDTALS